MRRTVGWWLGMAVVLGGIGRASAALTTVSLDGGLTPDGLANAILGSGVAISNATLRGCTNGLGTFAGGSGIVGFESGLMLSSGNIASAVGPNQFPDASSICDGIGDDDLNALVPGASTFDAAVLEFDFIPTGDTVAFQYVFASEEYNEFVGSPFNDVFGFFVNGVNLALLPGTDLPVAVNNVNASQNALLFVDNATTPSRDTEADGLTQVLSFTAPVLANQTNHIKLAIADVTDPVYDSWIFIGASSLSSTTADVAVQVKGTTPVLDVDIGETGKGLGSVEAAGFALVPGAASAIASAPVLSGPSGLTPVTKDVRRKFNKKGRAKLKLKLTKDGKKLLKTTGELQVLVVARVTNRAGNAVDFQRLLLLRK